MKVSLIQMNSQGDKAANLATAARLVEAAVAADKPDLVVLPEYYAFLGETPDEMQEAAETFPDGPAYQLMSSLAKTLKVAIHAGSVAEKVGNSFYNTTVVFGPDGAELARYRKIHLFDVEIAGGTVYRESDTVSRGEEVVTYRIGETTVGCAICYDIRFPELFRKLRDAGADVIVLPAAFTLMTGKDHWEVLARARAIETQTWFLAVGQTGSHAGGRKWCWGHSMVIDPWGHITAQCSDKVGFTSGRLDFSLTGTVRANVPVANHHVLG
ncbi:carbon-nitrogen hydrolase family protein [Xanthobacter oligotrophicus]|uniref:carbon-nitrogen hydrolase family protein n=1 Tax=Xanthobacter oligotrophicus TaxID=2607286 RepID=UPI0011F400D9|nr:carbon-nitrogen hydrolase family protein [Xanthobacter oligotrophicus]MCG5234711.1 carbon-nitrogen hydrolase family protein [Xanthobacter oligotrophicus]